MASIEDSDGYKALLAAVERDETKDRGFHDYRAKLAWILARVAHYAEKTGIPAADILDSWEARRDYWYMNYYQETNQPEIKGDNVRVFDTTADLLAAIGKREFRCPACGGVSSNPYVCNTGKTMGTRGEVCNWKAYGLFGTMGRGTSVYVKEKLACENIFMPVAWEPSPPQPGEPNEGGT